MDITRAITSIREFKGVKQVEMAERLSIDQSSYSRLEKKGDKLSVEQLKQISAALGVTLNELLTWSGEQSHQESELLKGKRMKSPFVDATSSFFGKNSLTNEKLKELIEEGEKELQIIRNHQITPNSDYKDVQDFVLGKSKDMYTRALNEYIDSLREKVDSVGREFINHIQRVGAKAGIGTRVAAEEVEGYLFYSYEFTDGELYRVFDLMFDEFLSYYFFRRLIEQRIIPLTSKEAVLFMKHYEQQLLKFNQGKDT